MPKKPTKSEAVEELIWEMRTKGAPAAYRAALEICQNPNAPAQSRATSAATILRAAGFLDKRDPLESSDPINDMTSDELDAALAREQDRIVALTRLAEQRVAIERGDVKKIEIESGQSDVFA